MLKFVKLHFTVLCNTLVLLFIKGESLSITLGMFAEFPHDIHDFLEQVLLYVIVRNIIINIAVQNTS